MSQYYYSLCKQYHGKPVIIRTKDGRTHRGFINHVDRRNVYLQPIGSRNLGGFGYGFFAPRGFGFGVALGSILTLALLPFFFW
ncbi:hypothetical protein FHP05_00395 [Cerasibacillus terrae]|uniref:Uncharacterized protein n=1 Tax=Cerasibacillus terrae TaxID=2498845 RepID=A0A5C8P1V5_9BACI|nr:hypothetical protein [Cerasibacillus terrae]TXL67511.1 hypothetical protein FHP05_00395 [Cerasibacillus terrae]